MANKKYDVLIAGAGPAGCSTALSLQSSGLKIALIDKAVFPREKICGDGITVDTMNQIQKLSPRLFEKIINLNKTVSCKGYLFTSANGHKRHFQFPENNGNLIIEREHFDNELLKECKLHNNIDVFEDTKLINCSVNQQNVEIDTSNGKFEGRIIVGADGANSIIARTLNPRRSKESKFGVAVRAYYKGIENDNYDDVIEIHYLKKVKTGYFWIFHLSDDVKNVGLGIDQEVMKKNNINLNKLLLEIIEEDPMMKTRFKNAKIIGNIKAHRLPYFNAYSKIYGDRILLCGDAANLVNPFSGEGVTNAIRSGRLAAKQINKCFGENNFSKKFNKAYLRDVKSLMFPYLRTYKLLDSISKYPVVMNTIIKSDFISNSVSRFLTK